MTTIKKILPLFVLMFGLFLTSCDREEPEEMDYMEEQNAEQGFFNALNQSNATINSDSVDCFSLDYPVTIIYPDGTTEDVASDDALETAVDTWYDNNEDSEDDPTLLFPVSITLPDGTQQSINDEDTLWELFEECYGDDDDDYEDDGDHEDEDDCDYDEFEDCFEFHFPITVILPDGTSVTANDEDELEDAVEDYYDENPDDENEPTLSYPVTVTLDDSTQLVINNDAELEELFLTCVGDEFEEDCFELVFPISFNLPDGSSHTVQSMDEAEEILEAYYLQNPDWDDDPELVFPVNIILEDGTEVTVNDEEEFEDYEDECD